MRRQIKIFILTVLFANTAFSLSDQISFSVSPLFQELEISPGKSEKAFIYVSNFSPSDMMVDVRIENWTLEADGSLRFIEEEDPPYACKTWAAYGNQDLLISPGETKVFEYKISVPKDTRPGHYWTSFSFVNLPKKTEETHLDQIHLKNKLLTGVFIKVGKDEYSGEIKDVFLHKQERCDEVELICENLGNFYWRSEGFVQIINSSGKKSDKLELPEELVLPGKTRKIRIILNNPLDRGSYNITGVLKLPGSKIEFEKSFDVK